MEAALPVSKNSACKLFAWCPAIFRISANVLVQPDAILCIIPHPLKYRESTACAFWVGRPHLKYASTLAAMLSAIADIVCLPRSIQTEQLDTAESVSKRTFTGGSKMPFIVTQRVGSDSLPPCDHRKQGRILSKAACISGRRTYHLPRICRQRAQGSTRSVA